MKGGSGRVSEYGEIPTQVTHVDGQVTVGFSRLVSLQAILGLLRLRE